MSSIAEQPLRSAPMHPGIAAQLEAVPLANAATVVALAAYLVCAAIALVAPDILVWFFQPWLHGLSLEPLRPTGAWFRPGEFLVGLLTLGGSVWVVTAAVAWLYNRWSHRGAV